ncbi:UNVERIFIED_CONTAM: hypothetical protein GTU68_024527, partial [Idotea baltica]|nr:hypothetical protein [Idotea baltica]
FHVRSLAAIHWEEDIPETSGSIKGNAVQKLRTVYKAKKLPCFADDTGLEITALDGRPGVYSARYAGEPSDSAANMDKVLQELEGQSDRSASFKTCIALTLDGEVFVFEGIIKGTISERRLGEEGFGYDPIFIPDGHTRSFAQMSIEEKNIISHRALAVDKMVRFMRKLV